MNYTNDDQGDRQLANDTTPKETQFESANSLNNITHTIPDHTKALVRIFVDGLALFCFNPTAGKRQAEFGFIRHMHDPIEIKIFKDGCNLIWSSANRQDFPHSTNNIGITINAAHQDKMGLQYQTPTSEPGDEVDLRQMPDLARYHNVEKFKFRGNAKGAFSARVDVNDATFYTHQMSQHPAELIEKLNGASTRYPAKKIGRIIGGDIITTDSKLIIKIEIPGGRSETIELDNNGSQYFIVMRNIPHNTGMGHLQAVYNEVIVKPSRSPEFDFEFDPWEPIWFFCLIGDNRNMICYPECSLKCTDIPEENKEVFQSLEEAEKKGYQLQEDDKKKFMATQFACESTGGGEGPLPKLPPDE